MYPDSSMPYVIDYHLLAGHFQHLWYCPYIMTSLTSTPELPSPTLLQNKVAILCCSLSALHFSVGGSVLEMGMWVCLAPPHLWGSGTLSCCHCNCMWLVGGGGGIPSTGWNPGRLKMAWLCQGLAIGQYLKLKNCFWEKSYHKWVVD